MPLMLNPREIMLEGRELMKSGSVSPIRVTALLLVINGILRVLGSVAEYSVYLGPQVGFSFLSLSFVGILTTLVANVLTAGYRCFCLGIHRREHMPYDSLFDGFAFAGKVIALWLVEGFFVTLWSMLFIFPGIIALFRYSFALWNLCDDPSLGVFGALNLSKRQTRGYKLQLLMLYLHFSFWLLLVLAANILYGTFVYPLLPVSTLGVVVDSLLAALISGGFGLFLMPYFNLSVCGFYLRATGKYGAGRRENEWYSGF